MAFYSGLAEQEAFRDGVFLAVSLVGLYRWLDLTPGPIFGRSRHFAAGAQRKALRCPTIGLFYGLLMPHRNCGDSLCSIPILILSRAEPVPPLGPQRHQLPSLRSCTSWHRAMIARAVQDRHRLPCGRISCGHTSCISKNNPSYFSHGFHNTD